MRFLDKVAIITGGGYGIGRAIANKFAQDGADIVIVDIREDGSTEKTSLEVESYGRKALAIHSDVRDPRAFSAVVDKSLETFGRVDYLINNAGIFLRAPLLDMTEEIWYGVLDVDLKAALFCTQAVARHWVNNNKNGKVVIIGSVHGTRSWPTLTAYSVAKRGLKSLTRVMALELAPHGINVNLVSPGLISTPVTQNWATDEEFVSRMKSEIPLGRMGEPSEVANAVLFLASDESNYITGAEIVIDGGLLLHPFSI